MKPDLHSTDTNPGWSTLLWLVPTVVVMALACFAGLATMQAGDEAAHVISAPAATSTADAGDWPDHAAIDWSALNAEPDSSAMSIAVYGD